MNMLVVNDLHGVAGAEADRHSQEERDRDEDTSRFLIASTGAKRCTRQAKKTVDLSSCNRGWSPALPPDLTRTEKFSFDTCEHPLVELVDLAFQRGTKLRRRYALRAPDAAVGPAAKAVIEQSEAFSDHHSSGRSKECCDSENKTDAVSSNDGGKRTRREEDFPPSLEDTEGAYLLLRQRASSSNDELPHKFSSLHHSHYGQQMIRAPPRSGHDPFRRAWMAGLHDDLLRRLIDLVFGNFVKQVLKPIISRVLGTKGDVDHGDRVGELFEKNADEETVVYQLEPSLRVHMPHVKPLGVPHCDADYHHQPGEINFWMPLSDEVFGTNSLFCESRPGAGDFVPFSAKYGEIIKFYGNRCHHFTVANETERTRVSIDIRVVPRRFYTDEWRTERGKVPFRLGAYYAEA